MSKPSTTAPTEDLMRPGVEAALARVRAIHAQIARLTEFERIWFNSGALLGEMHIDYRKLAMTPWGRAFARGERA